MEFNNYWNLQLIMLACNCIPVDMEGKKISLVIKRGSICS